MRPIWKTNWNQRVGCALRARPAFGGNLTARGAHGPPFRAGSLSCKNPPRRGSAIISLIALRVPWEPSRSVNPAAKPYYRQLYFWVMIGMLLGILVGFLSPAKSPRQILLFGNQFDFAGTDLKPLSDAFIRLIRMMITPIIFTTVVIGIAGMGNLKRLGRIGFKAVVYFQVVTTFALLLGWTVAAVFQPGAGMNVEVAALNVKDIQQTLTAAQQPHSIGAYLLNIIPDSIFGAFAKGDILQVLFVSVLFGIAMAGLGEGNQRVILALQQVSKALMRMIAMIIKLAPVAVFSAMSFTISKWGIEALIHQARIMACVYGSCLGFVLICLGLLLRLNGLSIFKFLTYIRDELFIVFGTASSESVLPRLMTKLENLGCSKSLVGLVLPAGYTMNLAGSSIYLTLGALFIAQATNMPLTFGQELIVFLVCLITSKSAAAVVGSAFITLAATLASMKTIPVEGIVLILGVDWFMAQARAMTNLVGNGVATIVVAKWENEFDATRARMVLNGEMAERADEKGAG
ncbi:MAG: C4-dicarboxylate transporter DctA [Opitutus sp.]|nr:C4-dicarboxylate transporter DctA [Opitutus sp.]